MRSESVPVRESSYRNCNSIEFIVQTLLRWERDQVRDHASDSALIRSAVTGHREFYLSRAVFRNREAVGSGGGKDRPARFGDGHSRLLVRAEKERFQGQFVRPILKDS